MFLRNIIKIVPDQTAPPEQSDLGMFSSRSSLFRDYFLKEKILPLVAIWSGTFLFGHTFHQLSNFVLVHVPKALPRYNSIRICNRFRVIYFLRILDEIVC